jgi:hypothetical protein
MTGKDALALEEEGRIEFNEQRGVYEEIDEDNIFMQTVDEEESHDPHAEMRDAGMSYADFLS